MNATVVMILAMAARTHALRPVGPVPPGPRDSPATRRPALLGAGPAPTGLVPHGDRRTP